MLVAVGTFWLLPISALVAQRAQLLTYRGPDAATIVNGVVAALDRHATPRDALRMRMIAMPGRPRRTYLEVRDEIFTGYVSCFAHGKDLYVGWTFWLRISPLGAVLTRLSRRSSATYQTLRWESAKATAGAIEASVLDGIGLAIGETDQWSASDSRVATTAGADAGHTGQRAGQGVDGPPEPASGKAIWRNPAEAELPGGGRNSGLDDRIGDEGGSDLDENASDDDAPTLPVTIYLSDQKTSGQVETAVDGMLAAAGLRIEERGEPVIGSFFRSSRAARIAGEAGLTGVHVADTRLTLGQDAAVTATLLQYVPSVLASLHPTENAVVRVGALLIVKVSWRVSVCQLTAAQQAKLDHQPRLALSPHEIIAALDLTPTSQTYDGPPMTQQTGDCPPTMNSGARPSMRNAPSVESDSFAAQTDRE